MVKNNKRPGPGNNQTPGVLKVTQDLAKWSETVKKLKEQLQEMVLWWPQPSLPLVLAEAGGTHEEQKHNGPVQEGGCIQKKSEPAPADSDGPLYLPYKTLVSTVSSTVFGEGEAQRLIEILTEKAGIVQDTWHAAKQKGDPVTVLKRQLEEKEKQLATKQEAAAAARNKVEELSQELAAERAKATAVEGKLKEQLLAREQEMAAVQARVQASYQDHVSETQQLQGKIRTLQEQLENGPDTQLARLQQENSILSDAFCQIRSQMESKQNAEVARLQEWCGKLMNELSEKSEVLRQEEQLRKSWKMKVAALERQMEQLQEKLGKKKKKEPGPGSKQTTGATEGYPGPTGQRETEEV
ncbi:ribosome-binding protein 1-like [Falco rusticolus]|uniref:ribosome-binding protein 1-like n=1 Tax=Falco rusticolus TaxID=120794 RepID=UPI001886749A|nr:ribosome-binding protein 1-like [Falco rusticolus]